MSNLKIILIGQHSTGKSSFIIRFHDDKFFNVSFNSIGKSFYKKKVFEGKTYELELRDTEGEEKFGHMTNSFYKNSKCVLLMFDLSKMESLENVKSWKHDVDNYFKSYDHPVIYLIGNKKDKMDPIVSEEGKLLANSWLVRYFEISAKTGENINLVIDEFMKDLLLPKKQELAPESNVNEPTKKNNSLKKGLFLSKLRYLVLCCCDIPYLLFFYSSKFFSFLINKINYFRT